jgi:hypothetical protein
MSSDSQKPEHKAVNKDILNINLIREDQVYWEKYSDIVDRMNKSKIRGI